jgi:Raf kinase inhibitor-like YbhB/YbcL family protein
MNLTSSVFRNETSLPKRYSGDGADLSPPLQWTDPPKETASFAIFCEDPDASDPKDAGHPFVHWVIYDIPISMRNLPEGIPNKPVLPGALSALQGVNSFGRIGYAGPMPPVGHGAHHYHFTLYALDTELDLDPEATKHELFEAMKGHILARATLVATYERGMGRPGLAVREGAQSRTFGEHTLVLASESDEEEKRNDRAIFSS